ncbi:AMP-binding protein [Bradyrhizobium sp. WSM 1738]|uniref:AMP-binding enzyme n=1 Tax=Bradyrhizobium hereditatis TaxID=2821405 RepID=UPI001CE28568|nr:AMP-binding protein [Bradyrhizobium hereditatis]MCA6117391.1 AMP-binding protein [Bradyrhizobium hereditatis]
MAELSEAINLDEIAVGLPSRIHEVTARQFVEAPDRIALVENGASWSYCDLELGVVVTLLPGVEGRIRTLDGIPLSKEQVGELHVRGRNVMRGYYLAPELTGKVIDSEGWFNTGNIARFDGDCLYILGRTKEMIGAVSAKLEAILNSHKDVQSAVIGRALNGDGELIAFVQPFPGSRVKATDLMDSIKPRLAAYIRPPKIVVVDVLPGSSAGKIREHELAACLRRDRAAAKQAARFQRRTHLT